MMILVNQDFFIVYMDQHPGKRKSIISLLLGRFVFLCFTDTEKISLMHDLDQPNKNLSRVWELIPPLSQKRVPQPAAEDGKRVGNGSRFAKFVMENNLLNEPTAPVIRGEERQPSPTLPSKL